jgi:hypothetical protein
MNRAPQVGVSLVLSTWRSSEGAMLRRYGESDVAHSASASFDYLLHITCLGISEFECPDASVGLSFNARNI